MATASISLARRRRRMLEVRASRRSPARSGRARPWPHQRAVAQDGPGGGQGAVVGSAVAAPWSSWSPRRPDRGIGPMSASSHRSGCSTLMTPQRPMHGRTWSPPGRRGATSITTTTLPGRGFIPSDCRKMRRRESGARVASTIATGPQEYDGRCGKFLRRPDSSLAAPGESWDDAMDGARGRGRGSGDVTPCDLGTPVRRATRATRLDRLREGPPPTSRCRPRSSARARSSTPR